MTTASITTILLKKGLRNVWLRGTRPIKPGQGRLVEAVAQEGQEQERLEGWIMSEVERGVPLPGLYPPNDEAKPRYASFVKK